MTLLTEKEAAEKWCPMARVALEGVASNRFGEPGGSYVDKLTRCVGSRCMAFRWAKDCRNTLPDGQVLITDPDDVRGYCGAFGKVEP